MLALPDLHVQSHRKAREAQLTGSSALDLNLLIALGALLEERNLTRAGEKINLSQPAMSGALARLRKYYGDELLTRTGRGYTLTPLAEQLGPAVQEALRQVGRTLQVTPEFEASSSDRTFSIALSDYTVAVLIEPLMRRVHELAPGVGLQLSPIPADMTETDRGLRQHDLLIAPKPREYQFPGQSEPIFTDRFVCIADPANPKLRNGQLSLKDLAALPHARATFGQDGFNPAERRLAELQVRHTVQVTTVGWLPLPFVVAGTDLVAMLPERLARRVAGPAGVSVVEPPFGQVELVEEAWWHPLRGHDPALLWLRGVLHQAAGALTSR
jgi:DNA-binding transcriptional LysR family regulator